MSLRCASVRPTYTAAFGSPGNPRAAPTACRPLPLQEDCAFCRGRGGAEKGGSNRKGPGETDSAGEITREKLTPDGRSRRGYVRSHTI